jgi:hypothetical protein
MDEHALLTDEHGFARALFSTFGPDQFDQIASFVLEKGPVTARQEMLKVRRIDQIPGPFVFLGDGDVLNGAEAYNMLIGITYILAGTMASQGTEEDFEQILQRGAGYDAATAKQVAEEVMAAVPSAGMITRFGNMIAEQATKIVNMFRDPDTATDLWEFASDALKKRAEALLKGGSEAPRNLVRWMRLGEAVRKRGKEAKVMGLGISWQAAVRAGQTADLGGLGEEGFEAGDPLMEEGGLDHAPYGLDDAGQPYTVDTMMADVVGIPTRVNEHGDPIEPSDRTRAAARVALANFMSDLDRLEVTPYHMWGAANPEEGGLFSSIGRALKKVARSVSKVIKPLASVAGGVAGTMLGGPLGTVVGSQLGSTVGNLAGGILGGGGGGRRLPAPSGRLTSGPIAAHMLQRYSRRFQPPSVPRQLSNPTLDALISMLQRMRRAA